MNLEPKTYRAGRAGWAWAAIFLVTLLAYFPAIGAGFIWNDSDYVTKPALQSLHGLWRIWFELGATEQYYPLLHSAFWFEHRLWGDAPMGYHLVNILLHATSACLFAVVLSRLGWGGLPPIRPFGSEESKTLTASKGRIGGNPSHLGLLAALLFALHPVCVESVAWISEQKNTLSTVFYLLSALAYFKWREEKSGSSGSGQVHQSWFYWLAFGIFILALLTKSVTATLPAALLVVVWWREGRLSWKRDFAPLIPWLALGAASGLFSGWVERTYVGAKGAEFTLNALERCLLAGRATWFYLGKLLWPVNLIFIYPRWNVSGTVWWQYLFPLAALALVGVLWLIRGRSRAPLAAFLFFAGSLFPTLGFFNLYAFIYSYVADHWQYLPSLGIIAFAAGAWGRVAASRSSAFPFFRSLPFLMLAAMAVLTWRQCRMYKDIETFYNRTIASNPLCWMAHYNLGVLFVREGRMQEGLGHYRRAVAIKPDLDVLRNDFGAALVRAGRLPEAIAQFRESVRANPGYAVGHLNLGAALNQSGRPEEAIAECREALRLQPDYAEANFNLALADQSTGRMADAIAQFQAGLRLNPGDAVARKDLGLLLANSGRFSEAVAQFQIVLRAHPADREALDALAQLRALNPP